MPLESFLVQLSPYDPLTSSIKELGFGSNLLEEAVPGSTLPYKLRLDDNFSFEVSVFEDDLPSGNSISFGSVSLNNNDGRLNYLALLEWAGRDIKIYRGVDAKQFSDYSLYFSGSTKALAMDTASVVLTIGSRADLIPEILQPNSYTGGGGKHGPVDLKGVPKPLCFSYAKNTSPVLVDLVAQIYQVHDGSIVDIEKVLDAGSPLLKGAQYSTYEQLALPANAPLEGSFSWSTDGFFRIGANPVGFINADVKGQFYSSVNLAETIKQVILSRTTLTASDLDLASFTALSTLYPGRVSGLYYRTMEIGFEEWLENAISSLDAFWFFSSIGKLTLKPFKFSTSAATFTDSDLDVPRLEFSTRPYKEVVVEYDRNSTPTPANQFSLNVGELVLRAKDEVIYIPTDAAGGAGDYSYSGKIDAVMNGSSVSNLEVVSFSCSAPWLIMSSDGSFTVSDPGVDSASTTVRANYSEFSASIVIQLRKSKGASPKNLKLSPSNSIFSYNAEGFPTPSSQTTVVTATKTNVAGTLTWYAEDNLGNTVALTGSGDSRTLSAGSIINGPLSSYVLVLVTAPDGTYTSTRIILSRAATGYFNALSGLLTIAQGKVSIYYQNDPPSVVASSENDLWFDTNDNNKLYRLYLGSWVGVSDPRIAEALSAAAGAQGTADGKVKVFIDTTQPVSAEAFGDLWYNPSTKTLKSWNGSIWDTVADVTSTKIASGFTGQGGLSLKNSIGWVGTELTGKPTELTDGRITAGLNASGDVNRSLPLAVANSSNLLRWTGGGAYAGELDADKTSGKIASGIAGQTFFATASTLDLGATYFANTLPVAKADAGLRNSGISINANGDLSGAGGGSVTYSGLGGKAVGLRETLWFGDGFIKESSGGGNATLAAFRTIDGIASGFTGQQALATQASIGWASSYLTGKPAELTDGRITAGLTAAGDVNRSLPLAVANSSNLLRRTSGGLYAGELDADKTSGKIASGVTGQSAWATYADETPAAVKGKVSKLSTTGNIKLGSSNGILNEASSDWITDASAITALGTASAIASQGPGATAPAISVLNYLNQTNVLSLSRVDGGHWSANGGVTGALKITLPQTFTSTMIKFSIDLFDYGTGKSSTYIVSGYSYIGGGDGGVWLTCTAQYIGPEDYSRTVRFGHDGTTCCVWIGETNSTWSYPKVVLTDLQFGFGNFELSQWQTGWSISLDTVAARNTGGNGTVYSVVKPRATDAVFGEGIFEAGGGALATTTNFKTSLGIASGFTGQQALATQASIGWASAYLTGRPAELTDGRITAGLNASGDVNRSLPLAVANSSNLLRRTSGGLFAGELDADKTSGKIASGVTGQSAWATYGGTSPSAAIPLINYWLLNNTSGAISFSPSDTSKWVRVARSNSASGRGGASISLSGGGGSITPFKIKLEISVSWSGTGDIVLVSGSSVSAVTDARIVQTSSVSYLEIKSATTGVGVAMTVDVEPVQGTGGIWQAYEEHDPATPGAILALLPNMNLSLTGSGSASGYNSLLTSGALNVNGLLAINASAYSYDVIHGASKAVQERGANITETRVASGFTGQGGLSLKNSVIYGSEITNFPTALNPANMHGGSLLNSYYINNATNSKNLDAYFPEDINSNRTEARVASAIVGQTGWATTTTFTPLQVYDKTKRLNPSDGSMESGWVYDSYTSTYLSSVMPEQFGANKTETKVASGIAGQGPGATAIAADIMNAVDIGLVGRLATVGGGSLYVESGAVTGAIKINLPVNYTTNTMVKFTIDIYEYSTGKSSTYIIGGYAYSNGPNSQWINTTAQHIGVEANSRPVSFGFKDGKATVWIGTTSGVWSYPTAIIRDVQTSFRGTAVSAWKTGWALSIDTSAAVNEGFTPAIVVISKPRSADMVFGENAFEVSGGAIATTSNFKTNLGIASSITGQQALATQASIGWSSAYLTGRPAELTDGRITAGLTASGDVNRSLPLAVANSSNLLRRTSGGLFAGELDADKTSGKIASGFTGQAPAATDNTIQAGADVTAQAQVYVTMPPQQAIYRAYTGEAKSGQFPRTLSVGVKKGTTDIRTATTTTYAIVASGVTATVSNATDGTKGQITVTDGSNGSIAVTVTVNSVVLPTQTISFTAFDDPPPTSSGGGGGSNPTQISDNTFADVTTTSYTQVTGTDSGEGVTVSLASGKTLKCTAPISYQIFAGGTTSATGNLSGRWEYRLVGSGTWSTVAADVTGTTSFSFWESGDTARETNPGSVNVSQNKTGLAAGDYEVRLMLKASVGRTFNLFSGTSNIKTDT